MSERSFTSWLYKIARASNTAAAASRGPEALAKREIRRKVYRATGRVDRRVLRKWGLSK